MSAFQLYVLKCADGTYYTGVTTNLEQRIAKHERAHYPNSYTARRRDIELFFVEAFAKWDDAFEAEKRVSKWSQEKKQKLISGEWALES